MKKLLMLLLTITLILTSVSCTKNNAKTETFGLVIHGGAGNVTKDNYPPELAKVYEKSLSTALKKGYSILENGGSSLDAVEAVVTLLENDSLFNAGKGAVFNEEGKNELDASIMNGADLNCGSVARVTTVKNPIKLARTVMEKSKHVFLAGDGAEKFAEEQNLEIVPNEYFRVESKLPADLRKKRHDKHGTVGCAALDKYGNLAAGTSTGGIMRKKYGRIGDSPIIGAGTYANNETCAVSCTGQGEFFIRNMIAYEVSAHMEFKGYSLTKSADEVMFKRINRTGGIGGLISIDKDGNIAMPFNTTGMFRGFKTNKSQFVIKLFK